MLKQTISFLLAFVLLFSLLSMTGCSNHNNTEPNEKSLSPDIIYLEGCSQRFMDRCHAIYQETGCNPIISFVKEDDSTGNNPYPYKHVIVNYYAAGFGKYTIITFEEYADIQEYQNKTGRQVIYPTVKYSDRPVMDKNKYDANIYYKVEDPRKNNLRPVLDENGELIPNYWKYEADEQKSILIPDYNSLRIEGESGFTEKNIRYLYVYGRRVDGGVEVRLFRYEYYLYLLATSPETTPSADEYFKRMITGD